MTAPAPGAATGRTARVVTLRTTFRTRLVLAAAVAVIVAVLAAATASYVAARNSLLGSVDGTLRATAEATLTQLHQRHVLHNTGAGLGFQAITPSGTIIAGGTVPVSAGAKAVAAGTMGPYFANVTIHGADYREYVVSAGTLLLTTRFRGSFASVKVALQFVLPLSGVDSQLAHLGVELVVVAILGIALALLLAWLVGRTALVPLTELISGVEDIAATTDVSKRLEAGGPDELGRLRRAFNHLLAALEHSQQAQRQLVVDAGHELRTPLTSLRTNLEVVRRLDELAPEEREVLIEDVLTQLNELTTLVGDLSELARGQQRPSEPVQFRLDRLVEDAVAIATTHGRPREVRFSLSTEPTWVRAQPDRIERAVGNLLDNALKWSPPGSVVNVSCHGGIVAVRDHGPGIPSEDLPHVFDRFYRAPAARGLPGSGLGLAIVAQVAQEEGGSVTAGEAPGGGALMRLWLPTVQAPAGTDPEDD